MPAEAVLADFVLLLILLMLVTVPLALVLWGVSEGASRTRRSPSRPACRRRSAPQGRSGKGEETEET